MIVASFWVDLAGFKIAEKRDTFLISGTIEALAR
jgi:hypothetical protein